MGILSDWLISIEPWLYDSANDQIADDDKPQAGPLNTSVAPVFLDWRWAIPTTCAVAALPAQTGEQPAIEALDALDSWSAEEGSFFVECDGFLIDRQTAAAACSGLSAPIVA